MKYNACIQRLQKYLEPLLKHELALFAFEGDRYNKFNYIVCRIGKPIMRWTPDGWSLIEDVSKRPDCENEVFNTLEDFKKRWVKYTQITWVQAIEFLDSYPLPEDYHKKTKRERCKK